MPRSRLLIATTLTGLLLAPLGTASADTEGEVTESPSAAVSTSTPTAEPNQPPVAVADQATVEAGGRVSIPVLANDEDDRVSCPDVEQPCLTVVGAAGGGDRTSFSGTAVVFTARSGDEGTFALTYDVTDGEHTVTGDVTVQVVAAARRTVSIDMADRPVALRRYAISGRVRPLAAGKALVKVQRRTPQGWVLVGKDATGPEGGYAVPFRTDRTGKKVFRAVARWDTGPRAVSGTLSRSFRAVADVVVSGPLSPSDVPYSWRSGCPVPPSSLRTITINRLDYHKRIARGRIVVRANEVGDIVKVFKGALAKRFPIRSMKPTDHYYDGGRRTPMESDKAAMRAGNTSAFNCRPVTGNPYRVSQHSYGNAVDINTIENPYVTGDAVYPAGSREYLKRSPYRRGMIMRDGVVANRMRNLGWLWGARWAHPDYQHFSSNGG